MSFRKLLHHSVSAGALAGLLIASGAAYAQDEAAEGEEASSGLTEIVVTAQKRSESAQRVPISVAVLGGGAIQQQGLQNLADVTTRLPTVMITEAAAGDQLFIRGIGSGINPGFEQSVGTFIDGIYFGRGRQSTGQLVDIDRIEVLKGPQSTYFGNNTIAGAINVATRGPGNSLEGFASVTREFNHDEWDAQGAIGGPVTDRIGVRVAGRISSLGGWMHNTYLDRDEMQRRTWSVRGTVRMEPTDTLTATLKLDGSHVYELGNNFQALHCPGVFGVAGAPSCSMALASAAETGFEDRFDRNKQDGSYGLIPNAAFDPENRIHRGSAFTAGLTLVQELPAGQTITSVTGYSWYKDYRNNVDIDFTPAPIVMVPRDEHYDQFSQELRLASDVGVPVEYIVGAYFQSNSSQLTDRFMLGIANGGSITETWHDQSDRTFAGFGAFTWNATEQVKLTLGLRYTDVRKHAWHSVTNFELDGVTPLDDATVLAIQTAPGFFAAPLTRFTRKDHDVTPSIDIQYRPTSRIMLYASYREGFKAGGIDATLRTNPASDAYYAAATFNPEKAKAYELGFKSTLFDGTVRFNMAAFRSDYDELQVSTSNGAGGFLVGNAGSARSQGLEVETEWAVAEGIVLGFSGSYLDAHYRDYTTAQCRLVDPRPNPDLANACIQTGERLMFAPKWSGNFNAAFSRRITGNLQVKFDTNVQMTSRFNTSSDNDPYTVQDGFAKVDARLALAEVDNGWEIALVGRNLTNEYTTVQANDMTMGRGSYFALLQRPRTIALQARINFR